MVTQSQNELNGRVALVTGAGTGIGRAAAIAFARKGAKVALAGRREEPLREVAAVIADAGGTVEVMPTDVSDEEAIAKLVAGVIERLERLDMAFNNAGGFDFKPIAESSVADFDAMIAINLRGPWLLIKHEAAAMRAGGRGGAIVNTSSFVAQSGTAGTSTYAASKGGLDAMIRPLAMEFGPDGIRINNIAPGVIKTPMSLAHGEAVLDPMKERAALKRLGEPDDVGEVAVWLCTDAARFVTGQTLLADGGVTMAM